MAIQYKIEAFHKATHSLQVNFYNEDIPEGITFSINLPMVDSQYPNGDTLDRLIRKHIPEDMFARAAMLRNVPPPEISISPSHPACSSQTDPLGGEREVFISGGKQQAFVAQPLIRMGSIDIPIEVV